MPAEDAAAIASRRPAAAAADGGLLIGQVAERTGHTVATLRHWEAVGLLEPPPREGGRRVFPEAVLDRIAVIDLARRAGFRLEEIRRLLERGPDGPGAAWRAMAAGKLAELDRVLAAVEAMRRLLVHLAGCRCASLEECATRTAAWAELDG